MRTLENRTELFSDLTEFVDAFVELNKSRPSGFDVSPIPIVEINAWLDLQGICDSISRREYYRMIKILDEAWMIRMREKVKKETKSLGGGKKKDANTSNRNRR